jgi:hypothetical protein
VNHVIPARGLNGRYPATVIAFGAVTGAFSAVAVTAMTRLGVTAGAWVREAVRCPHCALVLTPRAAVLVPRHCPRCVARQRRAVRLEPMPGLGQVVRQQSDVAVSPEVRTGNE